MAQTYSIEFKEEACKRVQSGVPAAQVARELGINVNTFYTWMSRFKEHPAETLHLPDRKDVTVASCVKKWLLCVAEAFQKPPRSGK